MTKLRIFDPPLCCSTGICGPDVDPALVQFAADLKWLEARGVAVERFNLGQQPEAFVENAHVLKIINEVGMGALPLIVREGVIVSQMQYPSREELARMAGVTSGAASEAEDHVVTHQEEEHFKDDPSGAMLLTVLPVFSPEPLSSQGGGCCSDGEDCC